jgi:transposase InsO family protein
LLLKVFPGINIKRTYRLWKELRLGRVKRYRKKRTGTPVPYAATMPNDVWTMDIIHDSCMNGTKLRILSIVDEYAGSGQYDRFCSKLSVLTGLPMMP